MKKILTLIALFVPFIIQAQSFTNYSGYTLPTTTQTLIIPITVSGLPNSINSSFGLNRVKLGITHSSDQELEVRLKAPDNTEVLLFTSVGGQNGVDFRNTALRNDGTYQIEQGTPPFNGNYIPMQDLNILNNGQNPNGTWMLLITDTYPYANTGSLDSVAIRFGNNPNDYPPTVFVCPTCHCPPGITDCDLVPDMTSSELVILQDMTESAGSLLIGNGTPNIGLGPLEVRPVDSCFCGLVQVPCTQTTCPGGGSVSQRLHQRIYQKHGNTDTLTFYEIPAGNMSYHPTHGHIHVDNWADFTLRKQTSDPDPRNWTVIGTSVKQSYCLINLSSCDGYSGACKDNAGNILDQQSQFTNYGLGYLSGCGKFQGIWPGKLDIYSSGLNSPIDLQSICNGNYYIVSITDPDSTFADADYSNNVVAVPVALTQQIPASTADYTTTQTGPSVLVNATGLLAGANYIWDFGDNSPNMTQNPVTHNYTANGTYIITLWVQTPCGDRFEYDTVTISGLTPAAIDETNQSSTFYGVSPNPSTGNFELTLYNAQSGSVKVILTDMTGRRNLLLADEKNINGIRKIPFNFEKMGLAEGMYLIRFITDDKIYSEKIIYRK
ncbi:MAG: T9SS type A sorting domain-containing protein [Chitinophagaceae bacterium]|nr:T9SS type A sorting domain-containing protein [Chitinophagaceae bacterium]